ncbi:nuclear transport factor 2 family protein [Wenzhouxiangella sp. XN24]|nr:nuclear transport factor 2 family protein [Wenzhouxiangella sp. XN24]NGX15698.1 nuclear transport factor 2 family protein [Wenzhouxiangella sp. XN24]
MFQELRADNLALLDGVYATGVTFEDPLHRVEGLAELKAYFGRLYAAVESIRFDFDTVIAGPGEAMLTWTMRMRHGRLRSGEELALPGATHIRFAERVHYHRDYFDAGALLYERLPVLGTVIRAIRRRV